jgi:hypothetical protein
MRRTLVGQTRDVPIDVSVHLGVDTLRAEGALSIKQTDYFGALTPRQVAGGAARWGRAAMIREYFLCQRRHLIRRSRPISLPRPRASDRARPSRTTGAI